MGRKSSEKNSRTKSSISVKKLRELKVLTNMLYCPKCGAQNYPYMKKINAPDGQEMKRTICASCRTDVTDILRSIDLQRKKMEAEAQAQAEKEAAIARGDSTVSNTEPVGIGIVETPSNNDVTDVKAVVMDTATVQ